MTERMELFGDGILVRLDSTLVTDTSLAHLTIFQPSNISRLEGTRVNRCRTGRPEGTEAA